MANYLVSVDSETKELPESVLYALPFSPKTIESGSVVGDSLVLIQKDGTEVPAGNVRGPAGADGSNVVPTATAIADALTNPGAPRDALDAAVAAEIVDAPVAKLGIYENFTQDIFKKFRAALARSVSSGGPARVSVYGDSNTNGFMKIEDLLTLPGGSDYRRSFGERARQILDGVFGPSRTGYVFSRIRHTAGTYSREDPRFTLGTGWTLSSDTAYGPAGSGTVVGTGPTGGVLAYQHTEAVDTYDFLTVVSPTGPTQVTFQVDAADALVLGQDSFLGNGTVPVTSTDELGNTVSTVGTAVFRKDARSLLVKKAAGVSDSHWVVNTGGADGTVSVRNSAYLFSAVEFRRSDASNYWLVARNGSNQYNLVKVVGGGNTVVGQSTVVAAEGDLVSIALAGNSIAVSVNGTPIAILAVTDAFNSTATTHGIRVSGTAAATPRFSDFTHRAPTGTIVNLNGTAAVRRVRVQAATVGQHKAQVNVVSTGTVQVLAVEAFDSKAQAGLRWTLVGVSSGTATQWNQVVGNPWGNQALSFGTVAPDLIVINLSINAHSANQSITAYKAEMATMITAAKAVADVILLASPPGGTGSAATWADYLQAQRELAVQYGCGLINGQARWGAYTDSLALGMWTDPDHPSYAGYWDLGQALADGIKLAAGRSA